jgi:hypothetical protein
MRVEKRHDGRGPIDARVTTERREHQMTGAWDDMLLGRFGSPARTTPEFQASGAFVSFSARHSWTGTRTPRSPPPRKVTATAGAATTATLILASCGHPSGGAAIESS